MDHIGQRIKELRKKSKLTQAELAKRVGVSRTTIIAWEKGKFAPERKNTIDLAKTLETSTSYLMNESSDSKPYTKEGFLSCMREQVGLTLEEAAQRIELAPMDLSFIEENENLADDLVKQKLIKTYGKYLLEKDGEIFESIKGKKTESEKNLEIILRMLTEEDPDLIIYFRYIAKNISKIPKKDKNFAATVLKAILEKIIPEKMVI